MGGGKRNEQEKHDLGSGEGGAGSCSDRVGGEPEEVGMPYRKVTREEWQKAKPEQRFISGKQVTEHGFLLGGEMHYYIVEDEHVDQPESAS